jgi:hypothetical protein
MQPHATLTGQGPRNGPSHALPRKYAEPLLYLAVEMAELSGQGGPQKELLRQLAETAGLQDPARQPWYRELSDKTAAQRLDIDTAKRGALVILALLIKVDPHAGEAHRNFFTRIRTTLEAEPITVPVDLEEHKRLAFSFLRG